jgi:transcriptional regulator with XRE-family HTH domain
MLAKRLQVTKSVISAYETGLRMPSYETLLMISKVFAVSTDYLLGNDIGKDNTIDVSGLSDKQIEAIKTIVDSLKTLPSDL